MVLTLVLWLPVTAKQRLSVDICSFLSQDYHLQSDPGLHGSHAGSQAGSRS